MFKNPADTTNQFLTDAKFFERTAKLNGCEPVQTLETVYDHLVQQKPRDFVDCIKWARLRFQVGLHNFLFKFWYALTENSSVVLCLHHKMTSSILEYQTCKLKQQTQFSVCIHKTRH